jgi:hypothetical protein
VIHALIVIAVVWLVVWALTAYVAKGEPGRSIIVAVGVLVTLVVLLRALGVWF